MQRHLDAFVAVFVMHVVNAVQGVDIELRQPFHHGVILFHDLVIIEVFRRDRG
ncbi:hypothetical protein D3C87_2145590 [compost metagenome]